ncbi:hypothetical protein SAMN04487766_104178 [Actinomyces ruminicola]|uniref:MEMO1 family protein SAMN04487766_104178 n=2 Tax=Actinomyces ruminicola TaxID=332524 RepID=A0A1H0CYI5_9ACTO|nr:hypothetical protein SAMN04487766_104178 [Actinomyces ruminicola]SDN62856.1 hypothetical protein SAMN05216355_10889 [Actinomyces ruminicola]
MVLKGETTMKTVRRPAVAGTFYPGDAHKLRRMLEELLAPARAARAADDPAPKAVVVPHAGYVYSGPMAARAYARLEAGRGRISRVVLLGPTHRVPVRGLALPGADQLATPLGTLDVDAAAGALAAALPGVTTAPEVHAWEHSLEVQLPFIQTVLGDVTVVPLAVGTASARTVADVIAALWGGPETVIVISSDLSHYLPQELAVAVDEETVSRILSLDSTITHDHACGATPLDGMLLAAREHGMRAELLGRCTSADTAGDPDRVVGYCAVALHEQSAEADPAVASAAGAAGEATEPPDDAGEVLLPLARRAIARAVGAEPGAPADLLTGDQPAWLERAGAAFVTLRSADGSLRGCIGSLEPHRPLGRDVVDNAVAAALRDPRFPPVSATELPALSLEVSVLTAPERMDARDEQAVRRRLRPGVDGVVLRLGARRATFLPQVWQELPDPADFLRHLKRKAGWPPGFWDPEMVVETYRVRAWEEP